MCREVNGTRVVELQRMNLESSGLQNSTGAAVLPLCLAVKQSIEFALVFCTPSALSVSLRCLGVHSNSENDNAETPRAQRDAEYQYGNAQ